MSASSLQYMNVDRRNAYEKPDNHSVEQSWSTPSPGVMKINVAASLGRSVSCAATICRDSQSRVVLVAGSSISTIDLELAEARAILLGLKLAMEQFDESCVISGDAKCLVDWTTK